MAVHTCAAARGGDDGADSADTRHTHRCTISCWAALMKKAAACIWRMHSRLRGRIGRAPYSSN
jgi:hypothetical protein